MLCGIPRIQRYIARQNRAAQRICQFFDNFGISGAMDDRSFFPESMIFETFAKNIIASWFMSEWVALSKILFYHFNIMLAGNYAKFMDTL